MTAPNAFLVDKNQTLTPGIAVAVDPATGAPSMLTRDNLGAQIVTLCGGGGGGGGGGATMFGDLVDATTVDLGVVNIPLQGELAATLKSAQLGAASGVAALDSSGYVPLAQINPAIQGATHYKGAWNASTNTPTLTSSVGTTGDFWVVTTAGTTSLNGIASWAVGDNPIYSGTAWQKIPGGVAGVTSLNGATGVIAGFALANLSDGAAQQTAITNATNGVASNATAILGKVSNPVGWNASTNTPTLTSSTSPGTQNSYIVTTAGATTIDGLTGWLVNDEAIFNTNLGVWMQVRAKVDLTSGITGVLPVANFATGTPTGTKFVRDDGVLAVPAGGGGGGDALTTNPLSQFASTTSAQLRTVMADETGTGPLVFGTAPTLTGIVTTDGANVTTANALSAFVVDVTKGFNTKVVAANSTFTFSGTPATANTWFSLQVNNSDTNAHILTFPSAFSLVTQAARTTCPIPANGQIWLTFRYDGSAYHVYGDGPYLNTFSATAAPTVTDDVSKGWGPGSFWGNATGNTLYWCESNAAGAAVWHSIGGGPKVQVLTDGATISLDANLGSGCRVTLAGNRTLANPTNLSDGQVLNIRILQDGTGSRTLAYGTKYKFPSGTAPVLSTAPNAKDFMSCEYDATDDTLFCTMQKAFA